MSSPHAAARISLKLGEWIIMEKTLPMDPDAALEEVEKFCNSVKPDIVVGITTACSFLQPVDELCTGDD